MFVSVSLVRSVPRMKRRDTSTWAPLSRSGMPDTDHKPALVCVLVAVSPPSIQIWTVSAAPPLEFPVTVIVATRVS